MRGPSLSMTSKTSSLKALLLRAWRERWSDLQWGIHIKTILPRGVSGDVYNLADCILQQALVGPGPNQLVVSYLKHSLSSQLVSYAAVLQRISKYDSFHKVHCVISLLEFLETIQGGITCRGKPEESLLAAAVLSIVQWLLTCMLYVLSNFSEIRNGPIENTAMLDKPCSILDNIFKCDFMTAMIYLAKHECPDLYLETVTKSQEVDALLKNSSYKPSSPVSEALLKLRQLESDFDRVNTADKTEPVTYCLQALLAVEVLLNPCSDTQVFVNELLMIKRLKGYSMTRLYAEIMRACFISFNDVLEKSEESQWGAFTFLKVPQILKQLHFTVQGEGIDSSEKNEFSQDVVEAFDQLLQYTPLLDILDARCSCNCVECLLKELFKVNLVTEAHVNMYAMKREGIAIAVQKLDQTMSSAPCIPKVIIRAEPTLARILKTLDTDYAKIQEALLNMLFQVLTGKSFELILAVAAVEGKLRLFASKLIKFNECSKQIGGEGGKASQTRALLFDVTFLMLCSIVHMYGSEVVLEDGGDSFFEQWVRECMVERGRPKSPDVMVQHSDPARVEALLQQFNSADGDFKISQVKWHEVCLNIPSVMKEVLFAWESGYLSPNDVKRILDAMRSRYCFLPVCATAWLCSYLQIVHQDALLKPLNMVQQFLTPLTSEELSQPDNFKERSGLMMQIIRKMQYDVHPPTQSKMKVMTLSHRYVNRNFIAYCYSIVSERPISEQLETVWSGIQNRGWINIEATLSLESLLNTGGAEWFVTNVVKEVLREKYQEELDKGVDLALGVFHLHIEQCTLALLLHVLPHYLHNQLLEELVELQASALAKLSAYCVFAALEYQHSNSPGTTNNRRDMEGEELEGLYPPSKLLRLSESPDAADLVFGTSTCSSNGGSSKPLTVREPLQSALNELFQTFSVIAERDGEVSQQTYFVCRFLKFVVQCGRDRTGLVLQAMPSTLVPSLLRALPDLFSTDLLLRLYDLNNAIGRKACARDLCMLRNMILKANSKDS